MGKRRTDSILVFLFSLNGIVGLVYVLWGLPWLDFFFLLAIFSTLWVGFSVWFSDWLLRDWE